MAVQGMDRVAGELDQLRNQLHAYHQEGQQLKNDQQRDANDRIDRKTRHEREREVQKQLIKQTTLVDGASPPQVRSWFREIDLTVPLTGGGAATIDIATRTITGSLRLEVERWIAQQAQANPPVQRDAIPWEALKAHIADSFLSADEVEYLRREVEAARQSAFETEAAYNRRFRDLTTVAYPVGARNGDQERTMLNAYIRGLRNQEIARELVLRGHPANVEAAMLLVQQYAGDEERIRQLIRKEEPMDVNVIASVTPPAAGPQADAAERTAKAVEKLYSKVAALELSMKNGATATIAAVAPPTTTTPSRRRDNNRRGSPRETRECYCCGKVGHLARDCWHRQASNQRPTNQRPSNQRPGNQRSGNQDERVSQFAGNQEGPPPARW